MEKAKEAPNVETEVDGAIVIADTEAEEDTASVIANVETEADSATSTPAAASTPTASPAGSFAD